MTAADQLRRRTCDELPAVVEPPFLNTEGSLARAAGVTPSRMPSSCGQHSIRVGVDTI